MSNNGKPGTIFRRREMVVSGATFNPEIVPAPMRAPPTQHEQMNNAAEITAQTIRNHAAAVTEVIKARLIDCRQELDKVAGTVDRYNTAVTDSSNHLAKKFQAIHDLVGELDGDVTAVAENVTTTYGALANQIESAMKAIGGVRERIMRESESIKAETDAERLGHKFGANARAPAAEEQLG